MIFWDRIQMRILFGFGKSGEYKYEYILFWKIIRIRIRILFGLKISAEYEYEYHYSVSTIRILFEYRIIRSPLYPNQYILPIYLNQYIPPIYATKIYATNISHLKGGGALGEASLASFAESAQAWQGWWLHAVCQTSIWTLCNMQCLRRSYTLYIIQAWCKQGAVKTSIWTLKSHHKSQFDFWASGLRKDPVLIDHISTWKTTFKTF